MSEFEIPEESICEDCPLQRYIGKPQERFVVHTSGPPKHDDDLSAAIFKNPPEIGSYYSVISSDFTDGQAVIGAFNRCLGPLVKERRILPNKTVCRAVARMRVRA